MQMSQGQRNQVERWFQQGHSEREILALMHQNGFDQAIIADCVQNDTLEQIHQNMLGQATMPPAPTGNPGNPGSGSSGGGGSGGRVNRKTLRIIAGVTLVLVIFVGGWFASRAWAGSGDPDKQKAASQVKVDDLRAALETLETEKAELIAAADKVVELGNAMLDTRLKELEEAKQMREILDAIERAKTLAPATPATNSGP